MRYDINKLRSGRDCWLWLSENIGDSKLDWPRYSEIEDETNYCYFCSNHFCDDKTKQCKGCPMTIAGYACERTESLETDPYWFWVNYMEIESSNKKDVKKACLMIAEIYQKEINKLENRDEMVHS